MSMKLLQKEESRSPSPKPQHRKKAIEAEIDWRKTPHTYDISSRRKITIQQAQAIAEKQTRLAALPGAPFNNPKQPASGVTLAPSPPRSPSGNWCTPGD